MSDPTSMRRRRFRRAGFALAALSALGALLVLFPGRRLGLAFTIATGIGQPALQARIRDIEAEAVARQQLSAEERAFLVDFYRTLATGSKLTIVVRQTGGLMNHYLDGSGTDYRLDSSMFTENAKVAAQMTALRARAAGSGCGARDRLSSPVFYMPDRTKIDSVFGLYYGTLHLTRSRQPDGSCTLHWRAEVPWEWPSYPSLARKYGSPHAESFPLPNLESLLFGAGHALFVDNGLGEHLAEIGLAKPFLAFAEWE